MKGTTGLAGLLVTSLVAALVAFAVAALLGPPAPPSRPPAGPGDAALLRLEGEIAALRARLDEAEGAPPPGGGSGPRPPAPGGGAPSAGAAGDPLAAGPADPSAPLPATRGDLVALIDARIAERGGAAPEWKPPPPKPRLTVEEAGAEMGLTPFEVDAVRSAYQAAEAELIASVMGTADLDAIKEEVAAAKEDPDRKAALVQKAVGNVIRNLGKMMTIEDRRDRDLRRVLSEEQVKKLKGYDLKPTLADAELEGILKDAFGGR